MELDNVDVLLGMTIASIILGMGLSMFFIQPYTGYGAVVLAIGMMTLALMITARPRVIERVKREIVLQPSKQAEPTPITPPMFVIPSQASVTQASETASAEHSHAEEAVPPQETRPDEEKPIESTQPKTDEKTAEKEEEPITAMPS